ncbi:ribosome-inactivating family protein [Spiroplasma endosymbiont of Lonchoptera lutea]|uniref:ribosome-inactivating family protein n=1 Tax=Spiroplasma endosymbiont of Lonchoptera lutea TaxID=3066297 RepID=UPI003BAEDD9E
MVALNFTIWHLKEKLNILKENKLLFNEEKVKEYLQQKNEIISLKEKEKNNKKLNYNNELNYLNKKISNLCGKSLKTDEIKIKSINKKIVEKYNCQKINLFYTGAYSKQGLNAINQNIIISQSNLNNAISNLSKVNNDNRQNQTTKNDLVQMIFITSESMRFGSYLKFFNYEKNGKLILQMMIKFIEKIILNNY